MDALRDWGHARDYVEMQWLMLQQAKPRDFVIATGTQYSVRDFVNAAARAIGLTLSWQGSGANESALISAAPANCAVKVGTTIVKVDPRYYRATEVETLLGDAAQARLALGWTPRTSFEQLVTEMAEADFTLAQQEAAGGPPRRHLWTRKK
jgi:GDPmannose 4,6-dehydratase